MCLAEVGYECVYELFFGQVILVDLGFYASETAP
jgi:hypothetical protein